MRQLTLIHRKRSWHTSSVQYREVILPYKYCTVLGFQHCSLTQKQIQIHSNYSAPIINIRKSRYTPTNRYSLNTSTEMKTPDPTPSTAENEDIPRQVESVASHIRELASQIAKEESARERNADARIFNAFYRGVDDLLQEHGSTLRSLGQNLGDIAYAMWTFVDWLAKEEIKEGRDASVYDNFKEEAEKLNDQAWFLGVKAEGWAR